MVWFVLGYENHVRLGKLLKRGYTRSLSVLLVRELGRQYLSRSADPRVDENGKGAREQFWGFDILGRDWRGEYEEERGVVVQGFDSQGHE